ncbi:MAG: hypothetical protein [Wendovervirus sonii]|uniref:Uncharacterized protein n=1 Tax=phage Lak_Megaphage_Sonny TaxID=3109229 RepID=A0ABZ0Z4S1_9CAUD|nr:MAG: hypothetical protein [phage Lak_Megaphage_Sonny]
MEKTLEIPENIINDIFRYCETQSIYDKLGNYGDFYYKLKSIINQQTNNI